MNKKKIAQKIKSLLELKEMSQQDLAMATGLSKPTINNVLQEGSYSKKVLEKIASTLEVSTEFLTDEFLKNNYGVIDHKLFGECIASVVEAITEEKVVIQDYNIIVGLAIELYSRHIDKELDVLKDREKAIIFTRGHINQQVRTGLIPTQEYYDRMKRKNY
jgi:transcriptional regulator with XRE-family HTH domain